jgi:hypothetical protein
LERFPEKARLKVCEVIPPGEMGGSCPSIQEGYLGMVLGLLVVLTYYNLIISTSNRI